jgi:hypothetical protein
MRSQGVLFLWGSIMSKTVTRDFGLSLEWQAAVGTDMILSVERLAEIIVKADFANDWFNDAHNEVTKETSDLTAVRSISE